ncbi:tetratricopeptide repeat protein [Pontiella sp.]|uniref:tetratricopeptide repeat protein n=2 Tax=Pontiella sp. TaxID=2837462 RepID=UPI003562302A
MPAAILMLAGQSLGAGVTKSQLSRLDPATESTSVLLETSKELLKNDQIDEALPFLEEVLLRLEGDAEKKARQTLAFTLYQLAYCQMKLGEYVSAARNFARFADEFPEDAQQEAARVMAAQCLTMVQQWPMVEEQSALVLKNPRLPEELKVSATQLMAEACYQQEKWKEATRPLVSLFRIAKTDTVRAGAAVMLVTCYVRLDDFSNLFQFLPHCDAAARHDVGLNVALLEAGDSHYNKGEFQKALLLYRLVLTKKELIAHYEERILTLKGQMKPFVAGGTMTLSEFKEKQLKQQQLFDRLKRHYEVITNFQDYDMDVMLRTAQCYNDLERNWPAHAIYRRIYDENPDSELADQACFAAFAVMLDEREWALATAEGYDYVQNRRDGEFLDDVTLNLMQVHMQQEQFEPAYEIATKALELSPDHKYIDQITYLMGYIRFMQFSYADALVSFREILKRWPESRYYESAEYWQSMSLLFLGEFAQATTAFQAYLSNPKYEERFYAEDATYRLGVAQYGAEQYEASEGTLRGFVDTYPESRLLSEAYAMLGDLRGAEGDMEVALDFYSFARDKAQNMSQVNYPTFQSADVLMRLKRYGDVISMLADYLGKWDDQADFANAANWQGKAYKARDEYVHSLRAYFDLVDQYGNDAVLGGVDLILNEVISDYQSEEWSAYREEIRDRLDARLQGASASNQRTLELRYQTVFATILEGDERQPFVDAVVRSKNVPLSGANTLVLIAREGVKREDWAMVHEASERFTSNFPISNNMLYIMLANLDALIKEGSYDEALDLSETILLKFGYSKSVGWARKRRGDVYRLQKKYELALEAYNEVLAVREWRGDLTPEALYCSGVCKMELGETEEAFAYFQRIYVLYEDYVEWVAPAYAKSIECLEILGGHEADIVNTYKEMLANEKVAATPEGIEAAKKYAELVPAEKAL